MYSVNAKITEEFCQPPIQDEIISNWKNYDTCKISVCMLSYNHEEYIEQAICSILQQKTTFPFEILIHDDASTDKTQAIISDYEERYPKIIKAILQKENQHSKKINPSIHYNYPRAKGEYIALCEGDDYWTDPLKLKLQSECLDKNKNINLCFHLAEQVNHFDKTLPKKTIGSYSDQDDIVSFEKVLFLTNGMIPTASCMMRNHVKNQLISFMKPRPHLTLGDRFLQFFGAYPNGAFFIDRTMSVYRLGTQHSWSASIAKSLEHKIRHEKIMVLAFNELNKNLNNALSKEISIIYLQRLIWFFNPKKNPAIPLSPTLLDTQLEYEYPNYDQGMSILNSQFLRVQKEVFNTIREWNNLKGEKIIYGAGSAAYLTANALGCFNITAIIDRDRRKTGDTFNKIPIISIEDLVKYDSPLVLVTPPSTQREKLNPEIEKYGVCKDNIYYLFGSAIDWLSRNPLTESESETILNSLSLYKETY